MNNSELNDANFLLFAAKNYDNPQCISTEEFLEDIKRFKYLKRLFGRYIETGEIKERLVINHLIILYNVFGKNTTQMLFFKLSEYLPQLKPFLVLMGHLPEKIHMMPPVFTSDIGMDDKIVNILRKI